MRAAGLEVTGDPPRIQGELAVARGIGDLRFKMQGMPRLPPEEQPVCVVPEFFEIELEVTGVFFMVHQYPGPS